jgi:hypothetical protein
MVLYTIVPPEIIFNENKTDEGVEMSNNKTPRSMEINYFGEKVQVLLFSDDSMIVDRIITSNFKSHLNPALQPGMTVDISKVFNKNNL